MYNQLHHSYFWCQNESHKSLEVKDTIHLIKSKVIYTSFKFIKDIYLYFKKELIRLYISEIIDIVVAWYILYTTIIIVWYTYYFEMKSTLDTFFYILSEIITQKAYIWWYQMFSAETFDFILIIQMKTDNSSLCCLLFSSAFGKILDSLFRSVQVATYSNFSWHRYA